MPANSDKTRERILAAAERLFAESGRDGATIRAIAAAARVPIALVSYHFGSKDALYRAIFRHRYGPLTDERFARLRAVEAAPPGRDTLESLVIAFLEPLVRMRSQRGSRYFAVLLAREASDPDEASRGILAEYIDPTARAFLRALERALPDLSRADIAWGYQFMIGAMVMHIADARRITRVSGGAAKSGDTPAAFDRLVRFAGGGFRALAGARGAHKRRRPQ